MGIQVYQHNDAFSRPRPIKNNETETSRISSRAITMKESSPGINNTQLTQTKLLSENHSRYKK